MAKNSLKMTLIVLGIIAILTPVLLVTLYQHTKKPIVINLWYTYEGGDVVQQYIEKYMSLHEDIQINFIEQPASGWLDKFISVAQTGDAPDIFLTKGSRFGELAELGYIKPLTNLITPQIESEYLSSAIAGLEYLGEYWGLPLWFDSLVLFYNKDLFDAKGVGYPQANWTEIELIEAATELTDYSSDNETYGLVWATISPYVWPAFQYGFGHGPLYQNGTIVVYDTASFNAVKFIYDLKYENKVVGYDLSGNAIIDAFLSGNGAMLIYGGWFIPTLDEAEINYGIQILPTISTTGCRIAPMVEIKGWGISKDTKYTDLCFDIIRYLSSKEVQEAMISEEFKVPTNVELINSPVVQNNQKLTIQLEQIKYSQYYPLDPIYRTYSDYMKAALQFILIDKQDIQTCLNNAQAGINANTN